MLSCVSHYFVANPILYWISLKHVVLGIQLLFNLYRFYCILITLEEFSRTHSSNVPRTYRHSRQELYNQFSKICGKYSENALNRTFTEICMVNTDKDLDGTYNR